MAWKWAVACAIFAVAVITIVTVDPHSRTHSPPVFKVKPGQSTNKKPGHVLLPPSETAVYTHYYLRNPSISVMSWQPSRADLATLEAALPQISRMKAQPRDPRHIADPNRYFLQYLPIVQRGKKQIFVSAFCDAPAGDKWRSHLYIVVDGGECYWQVYFDPTSGKFVNLIINGRA
ncbi:MAG TPA: hypothetical protein VGR47_06530 [Terracidiphilus sp.]|nr:hypothetical protein [Terracidiphilus sp.]